MLARIFLTTIFLIAGLASAAPTEDCPGKYRCNALKTAVEVRDVIGWHLAAQCAAATCEKDAHSDVPYCHDSAVGNL
ncbi:hypothetical protein P154DRAFT_577236 [Amniculicola lignicola CBS 123094]|uniref:Extracellular membrane protein CFEM domain-containing protein n=1 Tax=Amniculicola lignicola CBS 123094 TaxID=1392246 RepID=A0A6A5WB02_9PLEO|nr:hypothetical protein P154DRAFT_577236 [Amniculicola lignicola CBS 123094]